MAAGVGIELSIDRLTRLLFNMKSTPGKGDIVSHPYTYPVSSNNGGFKRNRRKQKRKQK